MVLSSPYMAEAEHGLDIKNKYKFKINKDVSIFPKIT